MRSPTSSYEAELTSLDAAIAEGRSRGERLWRDAGAATRLAFAYSHRAALTGTAEDRALALRFVDDAIARLGPADDLVLLAANLALTSHRVDDAVRLVRSAGGGGLCERPEGVVVLADVDAQLYRFGDAINGYERALAERGFRDWETLVRLAAAHSSSGDVELGDALFVEAEDELTAKQMRAFAWIELQRGFFRAVQGDLRRAGEHYRLADEAYSGWWLVAKHRRELAVRAATATNSS